MKKTGVVWGLKNIIDKIHPNANAPLTASESKRLLTALTSSFRKHLDAVHPTIIEDDKRDRASSNLGVLQTGISNVHSSAALAQKHMASVLTNPLLVKTGKSFGTAKIALQKNRHQDPIELLEEYDREGAATVRIAELCLQHVKQEYDTVPEDRKAKLLEERQPGRRTFLWLLRSDLYRSETCVDNVHFLEVLVYFLVREGRDDSIWQWIKLDAGAQDVADHPPSVRRSARKAILYKYRWRGRLIAAMVQVKARVTPESAPNGKIQKLSGSHLNAAMDVYLAAVQLVPQVDARLPPASWPHMSWLPLGAAGSYLTKLLTRRLQSINERGDVALDKGSLIDVARYDKLIAAIAVAGTAPGTAPEGGDLVAKTVRRIDEANLWLYHPTQPSAELFFKVTQSLFPDRVADCPVKFRRSLETSPPVRHTWVRDLIRSAAILAYNGNQEDAAWVRSRIPLYFPDFSHHAETFKRETVLSQDISSKRESQESFEPPRIPLPSFA